MRASIFLWLLQFGDIWGLYRDLLIVSYFQKLNLGICHVLSCSSKLGDSLLHKNAASVGIRTSFPKSPAQIASALEDKADYEYFGYVLDYSCPYFKDIFRSAVTHLSLRQTRPWLVFTETQNSSTDFWMVHFEKIGLRMDSNVRIAVPDGNGRWTLLDVHNPGVHLGGRAVVAEVGFFNGSALVLNQSYSFYYSRKDMSSMNMRSGSVVLVKNHSGSFEEYIQDQGHKEWDTMSKFHYPLFLLLRDIHNFTFNVSIEDVWFGNYQNGTDDGVGRLLYEDKIDITNTGASQRPRRLDVYDYLMPSYRFRPAYFFRNPAASKLISDKFFRPLSRGTWTAMLLSSVAISLCLKFAYNIEANIFDARIRYSWASAFLTTAATILQQESFILPGRFSSRMIFLLLLMMSTVVYNYYTTSIISSLLSRPPPSINTLDELGRSGLQIGIEDLPYTITWFKIYNDSDIQNIFRNKVSLKNGTLNIFPSEDGVARVGLGGFAYHTQADTCYPIMARTFDQDAICDLNKMWMIPEVSAGMMTPKRSQYRELFHISLRRTKEAGLVSRIKAIWEAEPPVCLSSARVVAVSLSDTFVAFLSLIVGGLLSLVILIIEIVESRLRKQQQPIFKSYQ